ncbi:hypothetical protein, partial [Vibrio sinaloensis]|uniref:hypothetical protein n=1 Tax=Photobacterium sp. (strain ATCC 43367) TaxID=379097 RepID=UPI002F3F714D
KKVKLPPVFRLGGMEKVSACSDKMKITRQHLRQIFRLLLGEIIKQSTTVFKLRLVGIINEQRSY